MYMNRIPFFPLPLLATLVSCSTDSPLPQHRFDKWHIQQAADAESDSPPWTRVETADETKAPSLVGRWQSDVMPSGYWVIDRFPDGHYVEKTFHASGFRSPHQIGLTWGRWKYDNKGYRHIIDGTNLPDFKRFIGKWKLWPILSLKHNQFDFEVNDGSRGELRITCAEPIAKLKMPHPTASIYGWTRHPCEVIEMNLNSVPRRIQNRKL